MGAITLHLYYEEIKDRTCSHSTVNARRREK